MFAEIMVNENIPVFLVLVLCSGCIVASILRFHKFGEMRTDEGSERENDITNRWGQYIVRAKWFYDRVWIFFSGNGDSNFPVSDFQQGRLSLQWKMP